MNTQLKRIIRGRINQFQSLGTVDGPGLRYVVFMQGCPLRCIYCHNPETWNRGGGESYTVDEVLEKILRCRAYLSGGVTVSGGEPLLQSPFVTELFTRLQQEGLHTALDTSGIGDMTCAEALLSVTDLVLCDLKLATAADYLNYTGGRLEQVLAFLSLTEKKRIPLWIRHVVVPGLTADPAYIGEIRRLASRYSNLEKIELLPFRKLCAAKYETLGIPFPLAGTPECSRKMLDQLNEE
ncbi:MAG: pyruvate formate-lyase-activating protein [Smithellaceae bacterium]|nr:pyruvate formate-lyase-activating protein [Smithellaceae bacterium]